MNTITVGLMNEANRILEAAKERSIVLRTIGAIAIRTRTPHFFYLHDALKRELTDIDFAALSKQRFDVIKLFTDLGFKLDTEVLLAGDRYIFHEKQRKFHVDVFFDKLEMNHTIDLRERLEVDYPTISLADLLLEKMQIVRINEKDIKDTIVLLREYDVGKRDKETINSEYISELLSNDWGFYYTVTTNLRKTMDFLNEYDVLKEEDRSDVKAKISKLLKAIEKKPKSLKWKLRAKVGPSKKWYREVEEIGEVF